MRKIRYFVVGSVLKRRRVNGSLVGVGHVKS